MIVVEHAAETLPTPNCSAALRLVPIRNDQDVANSLMISFVMIMCNELSDTFS